MEILKKESSIVWVLLFIMSFGFSNILLAKTLNLLNKDAWYGKWYWWILGFIFIFPLIIMLIVMNIYSTVLVASRFNVGGKDLYTSPYFQITCAIIPLVGWSILISFYIYLVLNIFIKLFNGEAEELEYSI